uniref:Uncharacterized protein n=1 Tax=Paramoeba aparasomata TaxID=2583407 RepID=A0A5P8HCF8_9EUKA|nr:hypothetical protein [Paramoeba aparasomata]
MSYIRTKKQTNDFVTILLLGKIITRDKLYNKIDKRFLNLKNVFGLILKSLGLPTKALNIFGKWNHSIYNFSVLTYIYSNNSLPSIHINSLKNNFKLFLYYLYNNKIYYYKNILNRLQTITNMYVDNSNCYYPYLYYCNSIIRFCNYYTGYNNYILPSSTKVKKNYISLYSKKTKRFPKKNKDKELFKLFKFRVALFNKPKVSIKGKFYYRFRDPKKYLHPFWQKEAFLKKKFKYFSLGAVCLVHAFYKHKGLQKKKKLNIFKKAGLLHFWFQKLIKKYKFRTHIVQTTSLNNFRLKYKFYNYYNSYKYNGFVKLNVLKVNLFEGLTFRNQKSLGLYKLFNNFYFKEGVSKNTVEKKILKTSYITYRLKKVCFINQVSLKSYNFFKFGTPSLKQVWTLNKLNLFFIKAKRIKNLFIGSSLYFFSLKPKILNNPVFLLNNKKLRGYYRYRFIKVFKLSDRNFRVNYFKTKKKYALYNKKNKKNHFLQKNFRRKHLYWKLIDYKYLFKKGFKNIKINSIRYRLKFKFKKFKFLSGLFSHRFLLKKYKKVKYNRYYIFKEIAKKRRLALISSPLLNRRVKKNYLGFSGPNLASRKVLKWFSCDFNKYAFKKSSSYQIWFNYLNTGFKNVFYKNIVNYKVRSTWLINLLAKNKRLKRRKKSFKIIQKIVKYSLNKVYKKQQSLLSANIKSNRYHNNKNKLIKKLYSTFLMTFNTLFFKANLKLFSKYTNNKKINITKYLFRSRSKLFNTNEKGNIWFITINSLMQKMFSYFNYFKVFKKNRYCGIFNRFRRRVESSINKKLKLIATRRLLINKNHTFTNFKLKNLTNFKKLLVQLLNINKKILLSFKRTRYNFKKSYDTLTFKFFKVFKNSENYTFKQRFLRTQNFSNFLKFWGYKKVLLNNFENNYFDRGFELLQYINYNNSIILWLKIYNKQLDKKLKFNNNLNKCRKTNLHLLDLKFNKLKVLKSSVFLNTLKLRSFEFKRRYLNVISWGLNNLVRKHYNFFLLFCKHFWLFKPVCTFKHFNGLGKLWNYCNANDKGVFNFIGFLNYNFLFSKNLVLANKPSLNNPKNERGVRFNNIKISELSWFKKKKEDKNQLEMFFSESMKAKAAAKEKQRYLDRHKIVKDLAFEFITPIGGLNLKKKISIFLTNEGLNTNNLQSYDVAYNKYKILWNNNFTGVFSKSFLIRYKSLFNHNMFPVVSTALGSSFSKPFGGVNLKFMLEKYIIQIVKLSLFEFLNTENIIIQVYKWNTEIIKHNKRIKIDCHVLNHKKVALGKKLLHNESIILTKLYFGLTKSYNYIFTS